MDLEAVGKDKLWQEIGEKKIHQARQMLIFASLWSPLISKDNLKVLFLAP